MLTSVLFNSNGLRRIISETGVSQHNVKGILRSSLQTQWMAGGLQALCCTSAFGMGINKLNVQAVIHYSLPASLEDYYQQTGRGGRDGLPCKCVLFFVQQIKYVICNVFLPNGIKTV